MNIDTFLLIVDIVLVLTMIHWLACKISYWVVLEYEVDEAFKEEFKNNHTELIEKLGKVLHSEDVQAKCVHLDIRAIIDSDSHKEGNQPTYILTAKFLFSGDGLLGRLIQRRRIMRKVESFIEGEFNIDLEIIR